MGRRAPSAKDAAEPHERRKDRSTSPLVRKDVLVGANLKTVAAHTCPHGGVAAHGVEQRPLEAVHQTPMVCEHIVGGGVDTRIVFEPLGVPRGPLARSVDGDVDAMGTDCLALEGTNDHDVTLAEEDGPLVARATDDRLALGAYHHGRQRSHFHQQVNLREGRHASREGLRGRRNRAVDSLKVDDLPEIGNAILHHEAVSLQGPLRGRRKRFSSASHHTDNVHRSWIAFTHVDLLFGL